MFCVLRRLACARRACCPRVLCDPNARPKGRHAAAGENPGVAVWTSVAICSPRRRLAMRPPKQSCSSGWREGRGPGRETGRGVARGSRRGGSCHSRIQPPRPATRLLFCMWLLTCAKIVLNISRGLGGAYESVWCGNGLLADSHFSRFSGVEDEPRPKTFDEGC